MASILNKTEKAIGFLSALKIPSIKNTPALYIARSDGVFLCKKWLKFVEKISASTKILNSLFVHLTIKLQFLCWVEPEQTCFAMEQIVLQHSVLLEVFFFENEPVAFFELERLFPVLIKAADKPFSMLESVWVCPSSFFALYTLRHKLTDFFFFNQLLRWLARDV